MFSKKSSKPQSRVDCLIGAGTKIEGSITFCGGLRVDGEIVGNITAQAGRASTLFVSDCARIQGEIRVPHLVVNGVIEGPAFVGEFLELQSSSRVKGELQYSSIEMHAGAIVDGRIVHKIGNSKTLNEGIETLELVLPAGFQTEGSRR